MADNEKCAICIDKMRLPFKLPCNHTFCLPCIKGACIVSDQPSCALCRNIVDFNIFDDARLPGLNITMQGDDEVSIPTMPKLVTRSGRKRVGTNHEIAMLKRNKLDPDFERRFWVYEGRSGSWWRYYPATEKEISEAYLRGRPSINLTICGQIYVIDFNKMEQKLKEDAFIRRQIMNVSKEELEAMDVVGVAGMKADLANNGNAVRRNA